MDIVSKISQIDSEIDGLIDQEGDESNQKTAFNEFKRLNKKEIVSFKKNRQIRLKSEYNNELKGEVDLVPNKKTKVTKVDKFESNNDINKYKRNTVKTTKEKEIIENRELKTYNEDFMLLKKLKELFEDQIDICNARNNGNGGYFDEKTGLYHDFDHNKYNDTLYSRDFEFECFVTIPKFLEEFKEGLQVLIENILKVKNVRSVVNLVKDPSSELAVMAVQGTILVKEKRSRKERIQNLTDNYGRIGDKQANFNNQNDSSDSGIPKQNSKNVNSPNRPKFFEQKKLLPIYYVKDKLLKIIDENQVSIIIGETGSGKSTQLVQYLYEKGFCDQLSLSGEKRIIGCTQPRRVAAKSLAQRVSQELNCILGKEVGYSVRFEDKTTPKSTLIKFMTDGILLRELIVDNYLDKYACIIIDEVHERSLYTDVLLGLFKILIKKRKDLKLIITSATMDYQKFVNYFGNPTLFRISGTNFPIEIFYSKNVNFDYVEVAVKQVLTIHLKNQKLNDYYNDGDILVFMTGQEDVEVTCDLLKEKLSLLDNPPPLDIFPVYSALPSEMQKKIFNSKNKHIRKVVISTNIAETSLTIQGIKYVIDSGLIKVKSYNPKINMDTLQVVPVSITNAKQRSGRAGRTENGIVYRLFTESAFDDDKLFYQPIPEIQRVNLNNVVLLLKSLKIDNVIDFPFLDPPSKDLLGFSLYELWYMGALDEFGNLKELGRLMTNFPMEPCLSKCIILSSKKEFSCSDEILTIVSMLSLHSVIYESKKYSEKTKEKFLVPGSDHLTLLNIYNQWESHLKKSNNNLSKSKYWCQKNFLQLKYLLKAKDIKKQALLIMQKLNLPLLKSKSDTDIKRCLCASFFHQLAKLEKFNINRSPEFKNLRHTYIKMHLHPTSVLNDSDLISSYVIYHELIFTSKEYISCVTLIDPIWLLEFGHCFYFLSNEYKKKIKKKLENF